jgi:hypothetical protein
MLVQVVGRSRGPVGPQYGVVRANFGGRASLKDAEAGAGSCTFFDCATWTAIGLGSGALVALVVALIIGSRMKEKAA